MGKVTRYTDPEEMMFYCPQCGQRRKGIILAHLWTFDTTALPCKCGYDSFLHSRTLQERDGTYFHEEYTEAEFEKVLREQFQEGFFDDEDKEEEVALP